jgi:hypothetical protein
MNKQRFDKLLCMFEKYAGVIDELTLFTSETHPPMPLEKLQSRIGLLAEQMNKARKYGIKAGVNVLATIGHHEENLVNSLQGEFTNMMNLQGKSCLGSFCPNDERVQNHIREFYKIIVSAKPDFIWIDDDVRLLGHLPIKETCFCDNCLKIFSNEFGTDFSRHELAKAINGNDIESSLEIRKKWLEHNRRTIARLLKLVESTVHSNSEIPIGFMTGERFYEGYDFDKWADILSGEKQAPVMWRPGGGFYSEHKLDEMVQKSHEVGRQVSLLGEDVISIQSEIENFPYQKLRKSSHVTATEAACHIAAGCTGAAFNLFLGGDQLDEYEPMVKVLSEYRQFYDTMVEHIGRTKTEGIFTGWCKDSFAAAGLASHDWFGNEPFPATMHGNEIFEIGLPVGYQAENSCVNVLSGDSVCLLDDKTIKRMLGDGIYMDVYSLEHINRRGFGELTGFKTGTSFDKDCIEKLQENPLNGQYAGMCRDGRLSFSSLLGWPRNIHSLEMNGCNAQSLALLVDYNYEQVNPCCMGIFENSIGGRVCVSGYFPWHLLQSAGKSFQIKSLMKWLSKDKLPAYIETFNKINIWVRTDDNGKKVIAVLNSGMDVAIDSVLNICTDSERIHVFHIDGLETLISLSGRHGSYGKFVLPAISPWSMQFMITE